MTFIDADDYYCNKEKLALEMALQEEKGGDIIAYSVTKFITPGEKPEKNKKEKTYYLSGNVREDLLITRKWDSIMRDYVVRADTLRAVGGYNVRHSLYEDYELLLVLSRDHDFFCTGEYGTAYTEGAGLSSADLKIQQDAQQEIVLAELERDDERYRKKILRKRALRLFRRRIRNLI